MSAGPPLLQTRGLCRRFGGVRALDAVDFSLARGELRCLIGPNGAGKSTFFKIVTGQLPPTAGVVLLNGESIGGLEMAAIAKRGVGIKTQVPNVFDGLSVRENVWIAARGIRPRHRRDDRVRATLARMGLDPVADETAGRLAHGQRQFVELGMVVAGGPDLILLDEPAAGLSAAETTRLAGMIHELNRDHTLLVIEHDMPFVRMIGKRVTVFHQGKILVEDSPAAIAGHQGVRDVYLGHAAA